MKKRNKFSLSHYKLFTCDMGYMIPITWFDVLPGDSIQKSTSLLVRVSPLLAPIMHPVRVRVTDFFVPLRIIWDDFKDFITGGDDGLDNTTPPYKALTSSFTGNESQLADYLGVPPIDYSANNNNISTLPFRAYSRIHNDWFMDKDLCTERTINTGNGVDGTTAINSLASACWEKDYFTTARTSESLGDTVSIPLTGDAPVYGIAKQNQTWTSGSQGVYETQGSTTYTNYKSIDLASGANNTFFVEKGGDSGSDPNIYADTSSISGVDINDLRLSFATQKFQEARNRYGNDFIDYLKYAYGVRSSDQRQQIPELLQSSKATIQFSEVLDHTGAGTLGDMAGHGIGALRTKKTRRFFEEHGIYMTILTVLPKTVYADGIHRSFAKTAKEDYFQQEFEYIGDQAILNEEVYADHATPEGTFGYQARYDEYRSHPSSIAGEYRSTLDHWHMARIFGSDPSLNSTFVTASPTKRMLASSSTDALYCMANHSIQARRVVGKRR